MDIYNNIAKMSLQHFSKLPKTGKPIENEWTILSTIVKDDRKMNTLEVVALGTGTKCIGVNQMSANGDILNDSHAEIICRRSFLKYLYFEIKDCIAKNYKSDLLDFCVVTKKFSMKDHVKFHFFTTHVPCGDATIFQKESNKTSTTETNKCLSENIVHNPKKKIKLDYKNVDIYRTGAKCLPEGPLCDPHDTGINFHVVGVIRTKPGRGDPTVSVSCSDKIAKWCYLGIQGSLLSFLLVRPIYINSFTIAGETPYSSSAFERAFVTRFEDITIGDPFKKHSLSIQQSDVIFEFGKHDKKSPCPSSISWWKNTRKPEVSVDGKKQGITKKMKKSKESRLSICKIELMRNFVEIAQIIKIHHVHKAVQYNELKALCYKYQSSWDSVKQNIFKNYVTKDQKLLYFTLDE